MKFSISEMEARIAENVKRLAEAAKWRAEGKPSLKLSIGELISRRNDSPKSVRK